MIVFLLRLFTFITHSWCCWTWIGTKGKFDRILCVHGIFLRNQSMKRWCIYRKTSIIWGSHLVKVLTKWNVFNNTKTEFYASCTFIAHSPCLGTISIESTYRKQLLFSTQIIWNEKIHIVYKKVFDRLGLGRV